MKRQPDYLQFRPYRAIVAPKLRPQKERDQLTLNVGRQTPRGYVPDNRHRGIILTVLVIVVLLLALSWCTFFIGHWNH